MQNQSDLRFITPADYNGKIWRNLHRTNYQDRLDWTQLSKQDYHESNRWFNWRNSKKVEEDERVFFLVTTLTKKWQKNWPKYFTRFGIRDSIYSLRCRKLLERIQIMQDLRTGLFDVLVGVNLFERRFIYQKFRWYEFWIRIKKNVLFSSFFSSNHW